MQCIDRCEPGEVCKASDQTCVVPDSTCTNCLGDDRCINNTCTFACTMDSQCSAPLHCVVGTGCQL